MNDNRSDPQGVFVFRYEVAPIARCSARAAPWSTADVLTPIVYRLNLTDANSLFLEQGFRIANRDLIYVSNAPSTDVQKVFNIFAPGLSTAGFVASIGIGAASVH